MFLSYVYFGAGGFFFFGCSKSNGACMGGFRFLGYASFFFPISLISLGLLAFYSFTHSRFVFLFMQEFLFMNCNFLLFSFLVIKRLSGVLWRGMEFFTHLLNTDEGPFNLVVTMEGVFFCIRWFISERDRVEFGIFLP